ncbi:alpha/beta fold hydrolase [Sphingomonas naphthae]|uniref:Alpha/beta fold hydrolase n=1 Tax=Sphingomonas naphthae TaxID=1813468 RepID=A0ABY7TIL4_9SPHN|nr:alpha/beta fold hydrolase [Sphingomonas naphthae]WCT72164.1 alpha/beta fold hydrolase [Sphingomonas naphthae]
MSDVSERPPVNIVEVLSAKIAYHDVGEGDAVIMIHGGGPGATGYSNYSRNIGPLSQSNRVIVIDLPGYGGSENREIEGSIFDVLSAVVIGLMDALGIAKASIVGNSLGGGTALRTAIDHPDRVSKLVLMGPGGGLAVHSNFPTPGLMAMFTYYLGDGPSEKKLRGIIKELVYDPSLITEELFQQRLEASMRPDVVANPPLKQRKGPSAMRDDLWREPLYKVKQPVLIIWGREDRVLPIDAAFVYQKSLPNAELHVFPKCGHWAQWEKADQFNTLVGQFLGRAE